MDNDRDSILFHFTLSSCFSFLIWKWLNTSGNNRHFLWERKNTIQAKMWLSCFLNIDCYMSHLWLSSSLQQSRLEWNQNSSNTETHLLGNVLDCCFSRSIYICKQCELTLWRRIFLESSGVFFHKVEEGVNLWRSSNRIPEVELCTPMLKHLTDKHTRHKSKQHACIASEKRKHGAIFTRFLCYVTVTVSALSVF